MLTIIKKGVGMTETAEYRERGIKALVALEEYAGINYPRDSAALAWDFFSDEEKEKTMQAYQRYIKGDYN